MRLMKYSLRAVITLLLLPILVSAQNGANIHIKGITVELDQHNQVFYKHVLKSKETLYSLSRYFQVPVEDLLLVNRIAKADNVAVGAEIIIPINKSLIRTPLEKLNDDWIPMLYTVARQETLFKISNSYFPQPIQNLITRNNVSSFSLRAGHNLLVGWWGSPYESDEQVISSVRESMGRSASESKPSNKPPVNDPQRSKETEDSADVVVTTPITEEPVTESKNGSVLDLIRNKIIKRGKRTDTTTSGDVDEEKNEEQQGSGHNPPDKNIEERKPDSMGNYGNSDRVPHAPEPPSEQEPVLDTLYSDLTVIDTLAEEEIPEPIINYQSGIAIWDREEGDRENLFVMHDKAKPNSYIRLRHPVTNKEVTAMVLCPIPKGIHGDNVSIILSPAVALALGALNTTFKIEMDYYQ